MWKSTGFFAKRLGVTRETIVNYINEDRFEKVQRTAGGHFRIWFSQETMLYGYCRVSSEKQKSSLSTQANIIRKQYPNIQILSDIGSGFNFKRKNFKTILEHCLSGTPVSIVATTQDRITRTGFHFIKWIVELYGGQIIILEDADKTNESFDTETLISFITSFINSYYGKRSHNRNKKDTNISKE